MPNHKEIGCDMYYFSLFSDLQLQLNKLNWDSYVSPVWEKEISPNRPKILNDYICSYILTWTKIILMFFILFLNN